MKTKKPKESELVRMSDVPAIVYKISGVRVSVDVARAWETKGRKSYVGNRVKLQTLRRLGFLFTCEKWVDEFLRKL